MKIEKATINDLQGVLRFVFLLHKNADEKEKSKLMERAKNSLSDSLVWFAKEGDKTVGMIDCLLFGANHRYFPNSVFINDLYVLEEYRSGGIGRELIQKVLNNEFPEQYKSFSVTHDPRELGLTEYYEQFGFEEIGQTDVGNIMMVKNIS
jgi:predicted N-acetyltransferase YhbS